MSLRNRIAILTIIATLVTVGVAALLTVTAVNRVLLEQVDTTLTRRVGVADLDGGRGERRFRDRNLNAFNLEGDRPVFVDALINNEPVTRNPVTSTVPWRADLVPDAPGTVVTVTQQVASLPVRVAMVRLDDTTVLRSMRAIDDVLEARREVVGYVVLIGVILGVVSGSIVWWSVGRATTPLQTLAGAAREAGQSGNLGTLRQAREALVTSRRRRRSSESATQGGVDATRLGAAASRDEVVELADSLGTMAASLEESRAAQRALVDDAAHELRTPLTSMRANLEYVARGLAEGRLAQEQVRAALDDTIEESAQLTDLINELVSLASNSAQEDRPFVTMRMRPIVERVATRAQRRSGRPIDVMGVDFDLYGDDVLIERALSNLVGNALKFSPTGAPVRIVLAANAVTVEDGGPGIEPEHRARVTERFWRAPAARGLAGSGLGLAIVADIARRHGGSVDVGVSALGGAAITMSFAQR